MKNIVLLLLIMTSSVTIAQEGVWGMSKGDHLSFFALGMSKYNKMDNYEVSIDMKVSVYNFYMEFSSNYESGRGSYIDYPTNYQVKQDKINMSTYNFGYVVKLSETFSVIPYLGVTTYKDIFQNYYTYYMRHSESTPNAGINLVVESEKGLGVIIGIGVEQRVGAGLLIKL